MSARVDPGHIDELAAIASVLVHSWQATFSGLLPAAFLQGLNVEQQLARHQSMFVKPGVRYQVAKVDGQVVGFASGGDSRHDAFTPANELYALYLLPAWQNKGIGRLLFQTLAATLQGPTPQKLFAMVLSNNPNQGFYQRLGGVRHWAQDIELGGQTVAQHAYIWPQGLDLQTHSSNRAELS